MMVDICFFVANDLDRPFQLEVSTSSDLPIIMAHYPTQRSSDLCFELFIAAILKHNAQVDGLDAVEDGQACSPWGGG